MKRLQRCWLAMGAILHGDLRDSTSHIYDALVLQQDGRDAGELSWYLATAVVVATRRGDLYAGLALAANAANSGAGTPKPVKFALHTDACAEVESRRYSRPRSEPATTDLAVDLALVGCRAPTKAMQDSDRAAA